MLLFAQDSFESYKQLATDCIVSYKLENPFDFQYLRQPGSYFYPWCDKNLEMSIWCILIALLLFWISSRVNSSSVYRNLAWSVALFAGVLFAAFGSGFPNAGLVFVAFGLVCAIAVNLTTMLGVAAVQKLPYFGVPEQHLTYPHDGSVKRWVMYVSAAVVVLLPYFAFGAVFQYFAALVNHNWNIVYLTMGLVIVMSAIWAESLLPWMVLRDHPILGGGFMRELSPIFMMTGVASRTEVVVVALMSVVAHICVALILNGSISPADFVGLFIMVTIGFAIIRAEMGRHTLQTVVLTTVKKKGPWT